MSNQIIVLLALLNEKNEVLVSLRKNRADHNGFWEYPGGKVEEGENIDQALIREVKEELNIEISKHCVAPLTFALDENERILLSVKINEIDAANKAFEDLMGGETDARKKFIAENSLKVANLDI